MSRLIAADVLKLARRRGLIAWSLVLTLGLVCLYYGWRFARGASPVGGGPALEDLMEALTILGGVAPIMLGCSAGAGDRRAGVLRDLVATGRPRLQLFLARVPAVLVVVVPIAVLAALAAAAGASAFAGDAAAPSLSLVLRDAAWLAGGYAALGALACGVAAALGSQATATGLLLGWQLAASNLLLQVTELGKARWAIPLGDVAQLEPAQPGHALKGLPLGVAALVPIAWALAAAALGAWRTERMDVV